MFLVKKYQILVHLTSGFLRLKFVQHLYLITAIQKRSTLTKRRDIVLRIDKGDALTASTACA